MILEREIAMEKIELHCKELLRLSNKAEFNKKDTDRIRDLICYISENKAYVEDARKTFVYNILNYASNRIRTFGYNRMNKERDAGSFSTLTDDVLQEYYKSSFSNQIILDARQKNIVNIYNGMGIKRMLLSAPTSFGKTFILKEIIITNNEKYNTIIVILPTIALLQEVSGDLTQFSKDCKLGYSVSNSVYSLSESEKNIYVLTPERFVQLLAIKEDLSVDFFFYDEIYKVDEDVGADHEENSHEINNRAFAFRIALYLLLKQNSDFYLAGPFIDLSKLSYGFRKLLADYEVAAQKVDFEPSMKCRWYFDDKRLTIKSPIEEDKIVDFSKKQSIKDKLKYLDGALKIGKNSPAIFFVLNPSDTYNQATAHIDNVPHDVLQNERLRSFIEHLEKTYCVNDSFKDWGFLKALRNNIGAHNGRLPKYIQKEVIHLFNQKILSRLFCTSTIVEGVNSNAKNIILVHTPRGDTNESKRFTLLNINGRAGRYMKHFVGNIVYTRKEQKETEEMESFALDFKLFNKNKLNNIDLENINIEDIDEVLKQSKIMLEESFNRELLDDKTFFKNRLIERKIQEKILEELLSDKTFKTFSFLINDTTINTFLYKQSGYKKITGLWCQSGLIAENLMKKYNKIIFEYSKDGYKNIINYYYKKNDELFENKIMNAAFDDVKKIIEYEVPKIFNVFQTLFNRVLYLKGINKEVSLHHIVRYFELGVETDLGADMIEKGLPVSTVKTLERKLSFFVKGEFKDALALFSENYQKNKAYFDQYEQLLLQNYLNNA